LIIREKTMPADQLRDFVEQAVAICRPQGSMVCLHADCRLGNKGPIDGIHYPSAALRRQALPDVQGWIGVSCHTADDLRQASELDANYAMLSPVKPTASHSAAEPLGWPRFHALCRDIPLPVYALGGLTFEDLDTAARFGAQGVAMLGAAWK